MNQSTQKQISIFSIPVLVAALGYFVDIYDLLMFSIIWKPSLTDLGITADRLGQVGENIIGIQMVGLLIGGIIWGTMGDKKGRLSVLFGSIVLYSVANILNGLVAHDTLLLFGTIKILPETQYAIVRFIAGVGLAGELGAGITLVSELVSKEKRGIATSIVAGIGLTGAVVAYFVKMNFENWRICYFIGGGLGFLLLLLRVSVFESGMFANAKNAAVKKGDILMFFKNKIRFRKYVCAILIGLPTWFVIGILLTFSPIFAKEFGITEPIDSGKAIMFAYAAISIADVLAGMLSQWMKSRKKAMLVFYCLTALFIVLFFVTKGGGSATNFYIIATGLGFATGFWAIFVTMGAEQFGTNLRATAATTIPNFVRGLLYGMIILCNTLRSNTDYVTGTWIAGIIIMAIAVTALYFTKETFGKDLNYVEE
jgi:MFS transporter, putative metabolite:H+ symporter